MTELVKEEKESEIEEVEKEPKKRVAIPEICTYINDEDTGYIVEIILPGVEEETIKLKMDENNIFITGETEELRYVGAYGLCCPVDPEQAKSSYKNGLLKIHVPYKDITLNTINVKIN